MNKSHDELLVAVQENIRLSKIQATLGKISFEHLDLFANAALLLTELEDTIPIFGDLTPPHRITFESLSDFEHRCRGLREYVNGVWATAIYSKLRSNEVTLQELGVSVWQSNDDEYYEFEFPFYLISQSASFFLNTRRLPATNSLIDSRNLWLEIMSTTLREIPRESRLNFDNSDIRANVFSPRNRVTDPDHFWVRPIIDSFVRTGMIVDDNAKKCIFQLVYYFRDERPALNIQVGRQRKYGLPEARSASLNRLV